MNSLLAFSDELEALVAIGNPFRFERSVSVGIISALDRTLPGPQGGAFEGLVQTDAAINPGNSGGPLVNARGEVVGINTAVIPYAQGMGFAVSAKTALWVAGVLIHAGSIRRRYLGIAARSVTLSHRLAQQMGQARALHILEVGGRSPAARAGVREEDYLLSVHGQAIGAVDDVHRLLVLRDEEEAELEVFSRGARRKLTVRTELQRKAA